MMSNDIVKKRKRGRPVGKEGGKRGVFHMRMSDDMNERLASLEELTGLSKADIFREAFNIYENYKKVQLSRDEDDEDYEEYDEY